MGDDIRFLKCTLAVVWKMDVRGGMRAGWHAAAHTVLCWREMLWSCYRWMAGEAGLSHQVPWGEKDKRKWEKIKFIMKLF